jgi:signal transduction histidine kinase
MVLLSIAGAAATLILMPFQGLHLITVTSVLVLLAVSARLSLPRTHLEITPVCTFILAAIWMIGPQAWIPAIIPALLFHLSARFPAIKPFALRRHHISHTILVTVIAGFGYMALGGRLRFASLSTADLMPVLVSTGLFIVFNIRDLTSLLPSETKSGPSQARAHSVSALIDFAFVPVSIIVVLVYSNWGPACLFFIMLPLLFGYFFLRKAFRDSEEKDDLNTFYRHAQIISASINQDAALNAIADESMEVVKADGALLVLLDEEQREVESFITRGALMEFPLVDYPPLIEKVMPMLLESRASREAGKDEMAPLLQEGAAIFALTPLLEEEHIIGFTVTAKGSFEEKDHQYLTIAASQASSAILNARLYRRAVQANEELKAAQAQLISSSKLAAVGQLAAGVAHELNNPLGAVLTNFQTLTPYLEGREDLKASLREAEEAVIVAKTTIEKLLRYSRQAQMSDQPVDMKAVIIDTLELLEDQWANEKVIIEKKLDETPVITANPNHLGQVVTNLCINAYDAIAESGREGGVITIRCGAESSSIVFSVRDNGNGIPDEVQRDIFKPFFTTRERGKYAGLGLSISRDIVRRHGGSIEMSTKINEGSVFTVRLPVPSQKSASHNSSDFN